MNISALIDQLHALRAAHGDLNVVCAADAEGNDFGALAEVTYQHYLGSDWGIVSPCDAACGTCEDCRDTAEAAEVAMLWPL